MAEKEQTLEKLFTQLFRKVIKKELNGYINL